MLLLASTFFLRSGCLDLPPCVKPSSQDLLRVAKYCNVIAGKSHALHKRVEQLCTRAIRWGELKRKAKVFTFWVLSYFLLNLKLLPNT